MINGWVIGAATISELNEYSTDQNAVILFPIKTVNKPCIRLYNMEGTCQKPLFISYITFSVNWCVHILMIYLLSYIKLIIVLSFSPKYLWKLLWISIFNEIILHSNRTVLVYLHACAAIYRAKNRTRHQLMLDIWSMLACCSCNSCLNNIIRRISNPSTKYLFSILLCAN